MCRILIILFAALSLIVYGQKHFSAMEADFVQTKTSTLLAEPLKSYGHLSYKKPDFLRWEYLSPTRLVWEISGQETNVKKGALAIVKLIMKSVQGDYLQENNDFEVAKQQDTYILSPKRKQLSQLYSKIEMRFNEETGVADEIRLYEKNSDITTIVFLNARTE